MILFLSLLLTSSIFINQFLFISCKYLFSPSFYISFGCLVNAFFFFTVNLSNRIFSRTGANRTYIIQVKTRDQLNAGTTSKVFIYLFGYEGQSGKFDKSNKQVI